jgi:hypothetical protein
MAALVSIIITTFGRPDRISNAVQSALTQEYENYEVIVVDDNGSGTPEQRATQEQLASLLENKRLKYVVSDVNQGRSSARNLGASLSSGAYITFLDDDDEYYPEKIKTQVENMAQTFAGVCLCAAEFYNEHGDLSRYKGLPVGRSLEEFLLCGHAMTSMIMVERALFIRVGGFDSCPRYDDHMLMLKLLQATNKPTAVILEAHHRINFHSGPRVTNNARGLDGMLNKHLHERAAAAVMSGKVQRAVAHRHSREMLRYSIERYGVLTYLTDSIRLVCTAKSYRELEQSLRHIARTAMGRYT